MPLPSHRSTLDYWPVKDNRFVNSKSSYQWIIKQFSKAFSFGWIHLENERLVERKCLWIKGIKLLADEIGI